MNEPMDRAFTEWLREGPENGPGTGLTGALAATRRTGQRPGWTLRERWLPVQLAMTRTPSVRPLLAIVIVVLLSVALLATVLFAAAQRRQPPLPFGPARNGAIVYSQAGDLFIADELGGTPRPLVAGPDVDSDPVFSRQGDRIAFLREGGRIMTVRPDGSDVRELTTGMTFFGSWRGPSWPLRLEWSPDGSALIATAPDLGREHGFVVRSDGTGLRELDPGPNAYIIDATWRPDGRQIAIWGEQNVGTTGLPKGARSIYLADADGTNVRELIEPIEPEAGAIRSPEWSPDGKHLSFVGQGGIDQVSIADVDENGAMTALRRAPLDPAWNLVGSTRWSPDGSQLAVVQTNGLREQIGVVEPDGSGFRIVWPDVPHLVPSEATGWADQYLAWSPDGRSLVFTEVALTEDSPVGGPPVISAGRTWTLDLATGQQTEVQTPVESWQRLAP
jgi:Tol biopolymer transport system component